MSTERLREQELPKRLDAHTAHADALAEPPAQEIDPLERLKGSVKRHERPLDGCWDYADDDGAESDELLKNYDKPVSGKQPSGASDPEA